MVFIFMLTAGSKTYSKNFIKLNRYQSLHCLTYIVLCHHDCTRTTSCHIHCQVSVSASLILSPSHLAFLSWQLLSLLPHELGALLGFLCKPHMSTPAFPDSYLPFTATGLHCIHKALTWQPIYLVKFLTLCVGYFCRIFSTICGLEIQCGSNNLPWSKTWH